jgi:hypothetical protein
MALFQWVEAAAAPLVWLHGLYIYSPTFDEANLVNWKPETITSRLYLSHVTLHGGSWGFYALSSAYLAGVQLAYMSSVLAVSASG